MTPTVATATTGLPGVGYVVLVAIAIACLYVIECAFWPFGRCRKCKGAGRHMSPDSKHFRLCRRCKGNGRRIRVGRRVWNSLRSKTDDA